MNSYRVLSETLLLGRERKYGDMVTAEEAGEISPAVLHSLVSVGILEGAVTIEPPDGWDEQIAHLNARLDQINEALVEAIRLLRVMQPVEAKSEPAKRKPGRPRKPPGAPRRPEVAAVADGPQE